MRVYANWRAKALVCWKIGIFPGEKGTLFYASGSGSRFCRGCNQLRLIYSLEGEEIYCLYKGPYEDTAIIRKGNYEAIIDSYQVDNNYERDDVYLNKIFDIPLSKLK